MSRISFHKLFAPFIGCHIGGSKDDFMFEIFLWKLNIAIDLTLPRNSKKTLPRS